MRAPADRRTEEVKAFIGEADDGSRYGEAYQLELPATDPPEETSLVELSVDVGEPGNSAVLTARFTYEPHFRLTAGSYQVAGGNPIVLDCNGVTPGPVLITPTDGITSMPVGTTVQLTVPMGTPAGLKVVRVTDMNDPTRTARRTIEVT